MPYLRLHRKNDGKEIRIRTDTVNMYEPGNPDDIAEYGEHTRVETDSGKTYFVVEDVNRIDHLMDHPALQVGRSPIEVDMNPIDINDRR